MYRKLALIVTGLLALGVAGGQDAPAASAPAGAALGDDPAWRADGSHVLVVYDAANGGSVRAAEYYAQRRRVPKDNLLGLDLSGVKTWNYGNVFEKILQPVHEKLSANGPDGQPLSRRVGYILLCPAVPVSFNSGHVVPKEEKSWFRKTRNRSVDGWLISVHANVKAGMSTTSTAPAQGRDGPLGASVTELRLPLLGLYGSSQTARHIRQLRAENPERFDFYLVNRLGIDLASARDMLDGALYAERYLRLPAEANAPRPEMWLDQKYGFAQDHVAAMSRLIPVVQGIGPGNPFGRGQGLQQVWPLVIDNQAPEIGLVPLDKMPASQAASAPADAALQHKPTVTGMIAADGVDEKGIKLAPRPKDAPSALYFARGVEVTNGTARGTVTGIDYADNRLLLASTEGFRAGDTIQCVWPGTFPTDACFLFYGFYGLDQYEDVFRFLPGALGIHVDSACMTWAKGAIRRGIAASWGVTAEPLSSGIPYGDQVVAALVQGYDWAEACYGGVMLAQRWTGVALGDPIYAPFRSLQLRDTTAPVLGPVAGKIEPDGSVSISAALAGASDDELADVALFRLEVGLTKDYGQVVDYYDWPEPSKSGKVARRYGYSRFFETALKGLEPGKTYFYRLTAKDPAGLTSSAEGTFKS